MTPARRGVRKDTAVPVTCCILETAKDASLGPASVRWGMRPLGTVPSLFIAVLSLVLLPCTLIRTVNMGHTAEQGSTVAMNPQECDRNSKLLLTQAVQDRDGDDKIHNKARVV